MVTVLQPLGWQQPAAIQSIVPVTMPKSRVGSRRTRPLSVFYFLPHLGPAFDARYAGSGSGISLINVAQSTCR